MFMNIKKEIEELLKNSLKNLDINHGGGFNLDHPQDLKNGDFTTNIAMVLAGKESKNPREVAQEILNSLEESQNIEKVEIAGPGYLNFFLSKSFYLDNLNQDLKIDFGKKEKILFEHSSPNLFKPFHIGHMVNNSIGESLSRILEFSGNKVINVSFPSDVSPGIAKTIWALKERKINIETLSLQEIADAYVFGTGKYEENKEEIDKINIQVYNQEECDNLEIYKKGKELSLKHFQEITDKLGSSFEDIIYESEAEKVGKKIVKDNIGKIFVESQGAVIFEGSKYGLFDNVFINSQDFGTYLTKDIGLLKIKSEKWGNIDKSLVITDVEQKQHFDLVKKSSSLISEIKDFSKKSIYLQHGRMSFSGNIKISSRYGNVPLAIEMIEIVQKNILEKMKNRDFSDDEKKEISEKLAIATLKYSILKVTSGKNITFDIEKDTNPQGDTATFLLYTYVRTESIFRKNDIDLDFVAFSEDSRNGDVPELEKMLYRFNEIIEKSMEDYSPHHLAKYLYDLAQKFNSLYETINFSDKNNEDFNYNLAILKVFGKTMKKGLNLLGIETVEKM